MDAHAAPLPCRDGGGALARLMDLLGEKTPPASTPTAVAAIDGAVIGISAVIAMTASSMARGIAGHHRASTSRMVMIYARARRRGRQDSVCRRSWSHLSPHDSPYRVNSAEKQLDARIGCTPDYFTVMGPRHPRACSSSKSDVTSKRSRQIVCRETSFGSADASIDRLFASTTTATPLWAWLTVAQMGRQGDTLLAYITHVFSAPDGH